LRVQTNKKKLFVLREESASGPARLEYYDTEKKMKSGTVKRTIILRACFNINKKTESRQRPAIVLFTKDDCFTVVCENDGKQMDWLTLMTELRNSNLDQASLTAPLFGELSLIVT